jgi:zinc protease
MSKTDTSTTGASADNADSLGVIERRLPNGLLVLLKVNRNAPVINFNIAYRIGSKYELPGQTGISHLLEHMMFKTTETYKLGEFDRRLKAVGADANAYTWVDQTVYHETLASEHIEVVLGLEADRMRRLSCLPDDHAFEMTVVRNELDQRDDNPFTLLYEELLSQAFQAHPYRIPTIGYATDVESITTEEIKAHYNRFYHPDNAFIAAVGDFEPDEMFARIERYFGAIPAGAAPKPRITPEPKQQGERSFTIRRAGQVDFLLQGWHIPATEHSDSYALVVLGNILGSGRTSRIYRALVDNGLCADASVFASNFGYSDPFLFLATATINPGVDPDQVEPHITGAIQAIIDGGVEESELRRARKQARASFIFDKDSVEREAAALVDFELMSSWRDLAKYLPGIEAVSAEDVRRVAREYLTEDNRTTGVYRAIRPQGVEVDEAALEAAIEEALEQSVLPSPPHYRDGHPDEPYALEATLSNGVRVAIRENRNNPTVSLCGSLRIGRCDDPPGREGLAAFGADMLSNGTRRYDKFALAAMLEDRAMDLGFQSGRESLGFAGRGLSEDFPLLVDALAEMLLDSNFPAQEIELTRRQTLSDIFDADDDTRDLATLKARELIYGAGHPFTGRMIGTKESVEAITRDDLVEWLRRAITPEAMLISVVGDVDADAALKCLEKRLGSAVSALPPRPSLLGRASEFSGLAASAGRRENIAVPDKSNATLIFAGRGPSKTDANWAQTYVAGFIFGGDFYSRLNERLRVKEGLTYGSFARFGGALAAGPLMVIIQVSTKNVEAAASMAAEEMLRYGKDGASAEELRHAQDFLTGNFPVTLSHNGAIAGALADAVYLGRGSAWIPGYADLIRKVTLEQVNAMAREYFQPEKMTCVAAGSF